MRCANRDCCLSAGHRGACDVVAPIPPTPEAPAATCTLCDSPGHTACPEAQRLISVWRERCEGAEAPASAPGGEPRESRCVPHEQAIPCELCACDASYEAGRAAALEEAARACEGARWSAVVGEPYRYQNIALDEAAKRIRSLCTPSTAPTGERGEAERCKRSPAPTGGHVFNPHDPEPRRCIWCGFVQSAAPVAAPGAEQAQRIERLLRAKLSFVHGAGAASPPVAAPMGALDEALRTCERLRDSWRYGSDGRLAANEIIEALRASQRNSIAEPRDDAATMAAAAFVDDGCKGSGATPLGSGDARPQTCASASPVTVALPRAITVGVESALAAVGRGYPQEAHVLRAALNASYSRGAARERAAVVAWHRKQAKGRWGETVHIFAANQINSGAHTPEGESEG